MSSRERKRNWNCSRSGIQKGVKAGNEFISYYLDERVAVLCNYLFTANLLNYSPLTVSPTGMKYLQHLTWRKWCVHHKTMLSIHLNNHVDDVAVTFIRYENLNFWFFPPKQINRLPIKNAHHRWTKNWSHRRHSPDKEWSPSRSETNNDSNGGFLHRW